MLVDGKPFRSIWLKEDFIQIIDQRFLPHEFVVEDLKTIEDITIAIKDMHVRGAPLIGVSAAYGIYLACRNSSETDFEEYIINSAIRIKETRPTAIDLIWAIDKQLTAIKNAKTREEKISIALSTANKICEDSVNQCMAIGSHGLRIIEEISKNKNGETVNILTHCNAGWFATVDYGTATAPIYAAKEKGIKLHVWVDETRPRNQGFLTAWELSNMNIPHTIIADNTGGHLMQKGMVDLVIVGSDRTTLNGDVTNKIGTYLKALAAKDNNIPFYAALPTSTIDWKIKDPGKIPIEERDSDEVDFVKGVDNKGKVIRIRLTPKNSSSVNYAFDVTPSRLVTGLITEKGICKPDKESIMELFK